jgi:hypothetical protein
MKDDEETARLAGRNIHHVTFQSGRLRSRKPVTPLIARQVPSATLRHLDLGDFAKDDNLA